MSVKIRSRAKIGTRGEIKSISEPRVRLRVKFVMVGKEGEALTVRGLIKFRIETGGKMSDNEYWG